MTKEDLLKIAEVIKTADRGCRTCVENLCKKFNEVFCKELLVFQEDDDLNFKISVSHS